MTPHLQKKQNHLKWHKDLLSQLNKRQWARESCQHKYYSARSDISAGCTHCMYWCDEKLNVSFYRCNKKLEGLESVRASTSLRCVLVTKPPYLLKWGDIYHLSVMKSNAGRIQIIEILSSPRPVNKTAKRSLSCACIIWGSSKGCRPRPEAREQIQGEYRKTLLTAYKLV